MRHHQLLDRAQYSRAAHHLIQTHGSRAATIAMKRAVHLHQCGEEGGADTWRKIADYVRALDAGNKPCAGAPESHSDERAELPGGMAVQDELDAEQSLAAAE